jgi:hypothetical protein
MLALSLVTLSIAATALYISFRINDDVFKAAITFTSVAFSVLTLFFAPWILKLSLVAVSIAIASFSSWSTDNF